MKKLFILIFIFIVNSEIYSQSFFSNSSDSIRGFFLTGINSYNYPDSWWFNAKEEFTIEFKFKTENYDNYGAILLFGSVGTQLALTLTTDGHLQFFSAGVTTIPVQWFICPTVISKATWNHVAIVFNMYINNFTIYLNGNTEMIVPTSGIFAAMDPTSTAVGIGDGTGLTNNHPSYDEMRIWKYCRSPQQIKYTKDISIPGKYPGLMLNMHFNEKFATDISKDSSGYNNHFYYMIGGNKFPNAPVAEWTE